MCIRDSDENELYQHFSEYEEVIQSSIYRVAKSRIANIIDNSTIVPVSYTHLDVYKRQREILI